MHSLTDVPVFALDPCQQTSRSVYRNIDIFFNIANCLGLRQGSDKSATATNSTSSATATPSAFTGAAPANKVQQGLSAGMIVYEMSIGWVIFNL